jgi:hypothetical protein
VFDIRSFIVIDLCLLSTAAITIEYSKYYDLNS